MEIVQTFPVDFNVVRSKRTPAMVHAVDRPRRVALVLAAGGPVGMAFHAGLLHALYEATGFDARHAQLIVGTSAGAQVGALLRAGLSTGDLYARTLGHPMSPEGTEIARCYRRPDYTTTRRWGWPASPKYLWSALARPWRLGRLGMLAAATLPAGHVDLTDFACGFRDCFGDTWPGAGLWVAAANLDTGRRVFFGREDAPSTDVGTAVAASSSVPSLCRPVRIAGDRYVDGGMVSSHHADALADAGVDEIIISSPLSRYVGLRGAVRRTASRLSALGRRVRCFEPDRAIVAAMGFNVMDKRRMPAVAKTTFESLRAAVQD